MLRIFINIIFRVFVTFSIFIYSWISLSISLYFIKLLLCWWSFRGSLMDHDYNVKNFNRSDVSFSICVIQENNIGKDEMRVNISFQLYLLKRDYLPLGCSFWRLVRWENYVICFFPIFKSFSYLTVLPFVVNISCICKKTDRGLTYDFLLNKIKLGKVFMKDQADTVTFGPHKHNFKTVFWPIKDTIGS